jgi:regulator of sirC expression with transglutaminase-like and TPR domain
MEKIHTAMNEKEIKALVSLLDDDDMSIVTHVEEKIISLGNLVIPYLESEWENNFNPVIQKKIEELIHTLQFDNLKIRLKEWKQGGFTDIIEGMWLVATYQYPDLEISKLRTEIEAICRDAGKDMNMDSPPQDQVKYLNNIIFGKYRFSANTKNFHSPSNSLINIVLESKKGNPISLCTLYMSVAQSLGMPVFGVNLPNLFILTYKTAEMQFYINAFNRGIIFSRADLENYVSHLNINPIDIFFEPCNNLDIIKRVLRNLIVSYEKIGDYNRVEEIKVLLNSVSAGDDEFGPMI